MELFDRAKSVRLRSHHDKYLLAEEDEETVCQDRSGSSRRGRWIVEFVEHSNVLHLKSCYGKYLTASNIPFLLGMTGRKVLQTLPRRLDSSVGWEPIREGFHVKLKTQYGNFLRANGGLPPWRNSVTHDIPHRTATQDWILWEVDIIEIQVDSPARPLKQTGSSIGAQASEGTSGSISSEMSPRLSRLESSDSSTVTSPRKPDGRTIYFMIADDKGNVDDSVEELCFNFKGTSVDELTHKLEEETELNDIIVCSRNPLNGNLYPLRLHLPPNNTTMHVVVVKSSSKVAKGFANPVYPA